MCDFVVSNEPEELGEWVRNFRVKKMQMKCKNRGGGNLRICAVLTTALMNAEHELRRKQQERFSQWLESQTNYHKRAGEYDDENPKKIESSVPLIGRSCASEANMSSFSNKYEDRDYEISEMNDLWRSEINSLDEFMRSISNKSQATSMQIQDGRGEQYEINSFNNSTIRESTSLAVAS